MPDLSNNNPRKNISQAISLMPPLRDVIAQHDLRATKKLGQNFLLDLNLTDKIARTAGNLSGINVFEVGPGPGGLTRSILQNNPNHLTAIEFDKRAIAALQDLKNVTGDDIFTLIHGDALVQDLTKLSDTPRAIIANLPYNIATPLLIGWLSQIRKDQNAYQSMTLMFQREVAQRITAQVGDKSYGRLSVLCQWLCDVKLCFDVPASAFTPPPKITSSIVHFKPRILNNDDPDFKNIEKITAAAFGQRRKMIRTSLKEYKEYFKTVSLDETLRAENISPKKFIELAKISNL